ncbi:hypothetical protein MTO96_008964 [Rhipicephalus appendiculatus]
METPELRDKWGYKIESILSCLSLSLGLGNIWRFPYLTYQNGGGSVFKSCKEANESLLILFGRVNSTESDAVAIKNGSVVVMVPRDEFESRYKGCKNANETSMQQFFYKRFLGLSSGITEPGGVQGDLFVALLVAWFVVFIAVCRGIRSSGKVAFLTVLVPLLTMLALLIRGTTLTGVGFGIAYYLLPKWRRLLEYEGMVITMGSYNEFSNSPYIDAYVIAVVSAVFSLVGGLVVFTFLGSMSFTMRISMVDLLQIGDINADGLYTTGLGLVLLAFPPAVSNVSNSTLWAATFFAMILCLTVGSQMAFVETLLSPLKDGYDYLRQRRTILAAVACSIAFLLGIPLIMQGGFYILALIDTEVTGNLIRWIALFEIGYMAIGYGISKLSTDAEFMLGWPLGLPVELCWKFLCPVLLLVVCISSLFKGGPLTLGAYVYPLWVHVIGAILVALPVCAMLIGGLVHFVQVPGELVRGCAATARLGTQGFGDPNAISTPPPRSSRVAIRQGAGRTAAHQEDVACVGTSKGAASCWCPPKPSRCKMRSHPRVLHETPAELRRSSHKGNRPE